MANLCLNAEHDIRRDKQCYRPFYLQSCGSAVTENKFHVSNGTAELLYGSQSTPENI